MEINDIIDYVPKLKPVAKGFYLNEKTSKNLILDNGNSLLREFMELNLLGDGRWLAGGCFRHLFNPTDKVVDFDMFFLDRYSALAVECELEGLGFKTIFQCPEGKLRTFKRGEIKIQSIKERFYSSLKELIDSFDITACRFVYDGKNIFTYYSSIRDTKKKVIRINQITYPNSTLKRIGKYILKDYTLSNQAIETIINYVYDCGRNLIPINSRFYID